MSRQCGPIPESPANRIRPASQRIMKPPQRIRLRSNGVRAAKCRAGVAMMRSGPSTVSCHQSSSVAAIPSRASGRALPSKVTTRGA